MTFRARPEIPSLRAERAFATLRGALAAASSERFRVLHFSVQHDHVHTIVEARDTSALSRGVSGLLIRAARAINRALGRRGGVWAGRYHARALRTPRETRAAIVYVLQNWKKHLRNVRGIDGRSSAPWFDGWAQPQPPPAALPPSPVSAPRTWLAAVGWRIRGGGPLGLHEAPANSWTRAGK